MKVVTVPQLGRLAHSVRKEAGLTQAQVAQRLSGERQVAQSHVSRAEQGSETYVGLAIRIIEEIGGLSVEPVYRVSKNSSPTDKP